MALGDKNAATIELSECDGIAELSFSSAERGNALTRDTVERLLETIEQVAATEARALIVHGGRSTFSVGAPLEAMRAMSEPDFVDYLADEYRLFSAIEALPCVSIAVLNGPVIGNAAEMALAFDLRVAAGDLRLAFPEVLAGVFGPSGRLSRYVGIGVARDILLSGRVLAAEEAFGLGLVSRVAEDPFAAAREMATGVATAAPLSVRLTKRELNRAFRLPTFDEQENERAAARQLFATDDAREGMEAAQHGRTPRFEGR